MGTPPRCEQTNKVKLLPSRRPTYAGGKYIIRTDFNIVLRIQVHTANKIIDSASVIVSILILDFLTLHCDLSEAVRREWQMVLIESWGWRSNFIGAGLINKHQTHID